MVVVGAERRSRAPEQAVTPTSALGDPKAPIGHTNPMKQHQQQPQAQPNAAFLNHATQQQQGGHTTEGGAVMHGPEENIDDHYQTLELIGRGHYGKVFKGRHRTTNQLVAIKALERTRSRPLRLRLEIEILKLIGHHPGVVALLDVFETPTTVYLVFELAGCELFDRLVNHGPYPEAKAARVTHKLATTLQFLHQKGIVHR